MQLKYPFSLCLKIIGTLLIILLYYNKSYSQEITTPFTSSEFKTDAPTFNTIGIGKHKDPGTARKIEVLQTQVGEVIETVNGYSFKMIFVKGGPFTMGGYSPDIAYPPHKVRLSDYYIGQFEVTQGLWKKVMGNNPSEFSNCGDNCPVESVSWEDCQSFINKLNQMTGKLYRLPTEAEWEYAAKGGHKEKEQSDYYTRMYNNGVRDFFASSTWFSRNSGNRTHPVGTNYPQTTLGLYDMIGNVSEWCNDWKEAYSSESVTNPQGANSGSLRARRGGSWAIDFEKGVDANLDELQVYTRYFEKPSYWTSTLGLRLVYSSN